MRQLCKPFAVTMAVVVTLSCSPDICAVNTGSTCAAVGLGKCAVRFAFDTDYARAFKIVEDNYYHRDKLNDFQRWQHKFDGRLVSKSDLGDAVKAMVSSLGDDYSFVREPSDAPVSNSYVGAGVSKVLTLSGNVGYLKIESFYSQDLISQTRSALRQLASTEGLILDLRNNHGGLISSAQDVFSLLTDNGRFISFDGYFDGCPYTERASLLSDCWKTDSGDEPCIERRYGNMYGDKPLLVLVNDDTRSAAELLAGALKDNGRALIVGQQTYGKGVLQNTYDIGYGLSIKLVTAKFFLPGGQSIHRIGLTPDIPAQGPAAKQILKAQKLLVDAISVARHNGRRVLAVLAESTTRM